jgi:copper oxidase (laccase) domain-containing protein
MDDVAWARQVHGTTVVTVDRPGCAGEADALVTATPGLRVAVRAADCGPLVLAPTGGRPCVAVVHVGWRGGRDGVVAAAAATVRELAGVPGVTGWLGPCIHPCCYRFGADDLDEVAAALGPQVRGTTADGLPALDLPAAVAAAAAAAGVELDGADGRCTACHVDGSGRPTLFSHRARGDAARHGVLACLR